MFLKDVKKDAFSATFLMMKMYLSDEETCIFLKCCFGLVSHLWLEKVMKQPDDSDQKMISGLVEMLALDERHPRRDIILRSLIQITEIIFKNVVRFDGESESVRFVLAHYDERCGTFLEALSVAIKTLRFDLFGDELKKGI